MQRGSHLGWEGQLSSPGWNATTALAPARTLAQNLKTGKPALISSLASLPSPPRRSRRGTAVRHHQNLQDSTQSQHPTNARKNIDPH